MSFRIVFLAGGLGSRWIERIPVGRDQSEPPHFHIPDLPRFRQVVVDGVEDTILGEDFCDQFGGQALGRCGLDACFQDRIESHLAASDDFLVFSTPLLRAV